MVPQSVVVCLSLLALAGATNVRQCSGGKSFENLSSSVQLSPCTKPPCKLKKGTNQLISIAFKPESDINDIKNSVQAEIVGIYLPFIGVDGNSICDKIYNEAGDKVSCPVEGGVKYVYKDSFAVLDIYPSVSLKVRWALKDGNNDVICFEVPARIIN